MQGASGGLFAVERGGVNDERLGLCDPVRLPPGKICLAGVVGRVRPRE